MRCSTLLSFAIFSLGGAAALLGEQKVCTVAASGTNKTDDAPAIRSALSKCNNGGRIIFEPTTYYVNSVLNITGLEDVDIDINGKLLVGPVFWSTDIPYWLNHSLPYGYQNQSTAFMLSGNNVRLNGHGVGNLDGNGDYWYQWIKKQPNTSNYPGRPHQITLNGLTNSVIRGLSFFRSQMWTMSIIHSHNNVLEDILVNNTGNVVSSSNTDGANTLFSSNITFSNWTIHNGDDSIALKANSTNISIRDSKLYNGLGIAIGSIGQYKNQFETIENLRVENVQFFNTLHALYMKTWTADQNGYPPNGGGGGLGYAEDMHLKNLTVSGLRGAAFSISQCTRFSGAPGVGNCTNSRFQIRDVEIDGMVGTTKSKRVVSLQCSAEAPCTDITLENIDVKLTNGSVAGDYLCGNVVDSKGWECTGKVCESGSATGEC
ncbi:putative exo-polygalacturonase [Bimuria novae-zelandiae CBS 107.79]|uniref:Putative exo-polygalacturonase n=1 Tax=Bimuria novae-zelandiae CBS 107.79 TaxID=1447943 RepID=A0A6A5UIP5_9PLEO|nr:putative exo-polygalacturonase [Bimuria novae-zelandiae CBS 107.79]